MTIVTPTDHPKSDRNCYMLSRFLVAFYCCFFTFIFLWYGGFCHRTRNLFRILSYCITSSKLLDSMIYSEQIFKKNNGHIKCCWKIHDSNTLYFYFGHQSNAYPPYLTLSVQWISAQFGILIITRRYGILYHYNPLHGREQQIRLVRLH